MKIYFAIIDIVCSHPIYTMICTDNVITVDFGREEEDEDITFNNDQILEFSSLITSNKVVTELNIECLYFTYTQFQNQEELFFNNLVIPETVKILKLQKLWSVSRISLPQALEELHINTISEIRKFINFPETLQKIIVKNYNEQDTNKIMRSILKTIPEKCKICYR